MIYMKADYEPWWQFEGWEEFIVSEQLFETDEQLQATLQTTLQKFRANYENETCKNELFYAFWSEDECEFCEACDEETQIYHGIIVLTPENIQI